MKVAIVGAGQIAEAHMAEIAKIDAAEVVGLCDLYESPLLALKEKYGIAHVGTDLADVIRRASPDVVHITTPPTSQLAVARQCLEAGAHIYVEKPLTASLAETKELLACAARHGRQVCLGVNRNFARSQHAAIEAIKRGEIGAVTHMDAVFSYDLKGIFGKQVLSNPEHWIAKLPGQVFQNNLNHPLAAMVPFLSDDLEVRARAADWSGNGVVFDELRVEIFDKVNKLSAYIVFTSNVKPGTFKVTYLGTDKTLFVDGNSNTFVVLGPNRLPGTLGNIFGVRNTMKQLSRQYRRRLFDFVFGRETFFTDMQSIFRAFYRSIRRQEAPPVPYEEVLRAAAIMDDVIQQIGRPGRAVQ